MAASPHFRYRIQHLLQLARECCTRVDMIPPGFQMRVFPWCTLILAWRQQLFTQNVVHFHCPVWTGDDAQIVPRTRATVLPLATWPRLPSMLHVARD